MTTKLQQHSDECGYALEALGKLLRKYEKQHGRTIVETAVGKNTIEILGDYQKEYRKIEKRNEEIQNTINYNFIQSEKSEAVREWEQSWIDWLKNKLGLKSATQ
jgi:hypothetical protein|tara:strand:- start:20 stop:331 length:312 start_codon:yes stop_codon:yes gene_type:complete